MTLPRRAASASSAQRLEVYSMDMVGRTIRITAVASTVALVACSPNDVRDVESGAKGRDAADTTGGDATRPTLGDASAPSSNGSCSDTPTLLIDFAADVPDAGRSGVSIPILAVKGDALYYAAQWDFGFGAAPPTDRGGALMRIATRGGTAERLAPIVGGGTGGNQELAVTSTAVVFSEARDGVTGAIVRIPLEGGETRTIAETRGIAGALVADDDHVYFVDGDGTKSVSLEGGVVHTLATRRPYSIGLVDGALVLADDGDGTLVSVPKSGGSITPLAANQRGALFPIACGSALCWVNSSPMEGQLMRLTPGGSPEVLATGPAKIQGLTFDGAYFFVTGGLGGIERVPAQGGEGTGVEEPTFALSVAFDEHCLFGSGRHGIFSMSRKAADAP